MKDLFELFYHLTDTILGSEQVQGVWVSPLSISWKVERKLPRAGLELRKLQ